MHEETESKQGIEQEKYELHVFTNEMAVLNEINKQFPGDPEEITFEIMDKIEALLASDNVIRTLVSYFHDLTVHEKRAPKLLSEHMQLAEEVKKLKREVEEYKVDSMTGLPQKKFFEKWFPGAQAFVRRSHRENKEVPQEISMLFVDADHFKKVNDTYGHDAGNKVLEMIGRTLRETIKRKSDGAFRYGGEEFLIVLNGCTCQKAFEIAENIRQTIEKTPVILEDGRVVRITVSIGLSTINGVEADPNKIRDVAIKIADKAVYASKENGRNRTTVYKNLSASDIKEAGDANGVVISIDPENGKLTFVPKAK